MGRVKYDEVDKYGGQGGAGFFSLKDDGDTARVRFMYNGIDDVEAFAVHQIEGEDGRKRYVNCLREYRQPLDTCPFCRERKPTQVKLFVPIYNVDEDKVQIWERGKKFVQKMVSLCGRYSNSDTPLCAHEFDIERRGKKGDTSTTYEIYPGDKDDTTLEDLPDVPNPLGGLVLDKTAEDMEFFLESGYFPPDGEDDADEQPVRRRESRDRERDEAPRRRTPGRGRDVY